jgi:DNA-binding CsgD family transcriptional regulator
MPLNALQSSIKRLEHCRRVADVTGVAIDGMRAAFGCHVGAAILLDDSLTLKDQATLGVRDADLDDYHVHWRSTDLVLATVIERATPVHNWQIYRPDAHPPMYLHYGRRYDAYHYLSAPLFGSRGTIAGVLNMCRRQRMRPFTASDLGLALAFSGFLSATLSRVAAEGPAMVVGPFARKLTPREWEVARLAAAGRNNLQIALQLGLARETVKQTLRRVFRKMGANGRGQMAAKLGAAGFV